MPEIPPRPLLSKLADIAAIAQVFAVIAAFVAIWVQFEASNRNEAANRNQRTLELVRNELFTVREAAVQFRDEAAKLKEDAKNAGKPFKFTSRLESQAGKIFDSLEIARICSEMDLCDDELLDNLFCPEVSVFLAHGDSLAQFADKKAAEFIHSCKQSQ